MKALLYCFAGLAMAAAVCSCGGNASKEGQPVESLRLEPVASDTTEVRGLVDAFMGHLQAGEVADAIDMLGNNNQDSISSYDGTPLDLPDDVKERYTKRYSGLDIERYEIESFDFGGYANNQVRVRMYFTGGGQRVINFNPKRGVKSWRLTLRDSSRGDRSFHR